MLVFLKSLRWTHFLTYNYFYKSLIKVFLYFNPAISPLEIIPKEIIGIHTKANERPESKPVRSVLCG